MCVFSPESDRQTLAQSDRCGRKSGAGEFGLSVAHMPMISGASIGNCQTLARSTAAFACDRFFFPIYLASFIRVPRVPPISKRTMAYLRSVLLLTTLLFCSAAVEGLRLRGPATADGNETANDQGKSSLTVVQAWEFATAGQTPPYDKWSRPGKREGVEFVVTLSINSKLPGAFCLLGRIYVDI